MEDSGQESSGNTSALSLVILIAALALSILAIRWLGDRLMVRAIVGTLWGLYCLYAFGIAPFLRRKAERGRDSRSRMS